MEVRDLEGMSMQVSLKSFLGVLEPHFQQFSSKLLFVLKHRKVNGIAI